MGRPTRYDIQDLLQQDRVWQDSGGSLHRLKDMERSHRANLIAWLLRRAAGIQNAEIARLSSYWADDEEGSLENALQRISDLSPAEYMRTQPLYRKLIEINGSDPMDGPDYEPESPEPRSRVRMPPQAPDITKLLGVVFTHPAQRKLDGTLAWLDKRIDQLDRRGSDLVRIELELVREMLRTD